MEPYRWKFKTLGGQQFWTDVQIVDGWKIQRNEVYGQFRVIDTANVRQYSGELEKCKKLVDSKLAKGEIEPYSGEVVVILHGLMRSRRPLVPMAKHLEKSTSFTPILFEYGSSRKPVASHSAALKSVLEGLGPKVDRIHFVGHSLGNLVVRGMLHSLDKEHPLHKKMGRMVMLGPPNQGSRMARLLKNSAMFSIVAGVSGAQLSTGWEKLEPELATPSFEFGIIAGGQNNSRFSNFMLKGPDDFTVSTEETKLVGASDFLVRPLVHSSMMKKTEVLKATESFLENGYFLSREKRNPILSLEEAK